MCAQELTADQQLIVACHRLEVSQVVELLRNGANIEATFGDADSKNYFVDKWAGGTPMSAGQWTPLQALANSSRYPEPPREYENTSEHYRWVKETQKTIPKAEFEKRSQRRIQILAILLSHGCAINVADDRGATPLYNALYSRHEAMAKRLLDFKPNVNIKTGIYIDGTGDITPLHRAYWSTDLTKRLVELGANDDAKDSAGHTPKNWRRLHAPLKTP
ncbi:ankyrin repeat domain-containing protein [Mariniblastus sp.]|nr:ankyrin repeat domain-containing protein [Mariniblastus sp.]